MSPAPEPEPCAIGAERPYALLQQGRQERESYENSKAEAHLREAVDLLAFLSAQPPPAAAAPSPAEAPSPAASAGGAEPPAPAGEESEVVRRALVELLHAHALLELAEVRSELGDLAGAETCYVRATELFGRLLMRYHAGETKALGPHFSLRDLSLAVDRSDDGLEFVRIRMGMELPDVGLLCGCTGAAEDDSPTAEYEDDNRI